MHTWSFYIERRKEISFSDSSFIHDAIYDAHSTRTAGPQFRQESAQSAQFHSKTQEDHKILTTRDWARAITCDNHSYPSIHTYSQHQHLSPHARSSLQSQFPGPFSNSNEELSCTRHLLFDHFSRISRYARIYSGAKLCKIITCEVLRVDRQKEANLTPGPAILACKLLFPPY